ncbi:multidrug/biocide efflux PACE transporter [Pseudomonas sp. CrR25]|nr:multidrug/biocide efflux PACE transporter [Pseudomonas sp. CrR25]
MQADKSLRERVLQAVGFETLAILLTTPVLAWSMEAQWQEMGVVTVANCLIALAWNVLFNRAFDKLRQRWRMAQSVPVRMTHALLFEGGLLVICVPFAAWWLDIGLVAALVMDIGLLLFFLPYTYLYHWAYDASREPVRLWYGSLFPRHYARGKGR